jgi:hypothetical protein
MHKNVKKIDTLLKELNRDELLDVLDNLNRKYFTPKGHRIGAASRYRAITEGRHLGSVHKDSDSSDDICPICGKPL